MLGWLKISSMGWSNKSCTAKFMGGMIFESMWGIPSMYTYVLYSIFRQTLVVHWNPCLGRPLYIYMKHLHKKVPLEFWTSKKCRYQAGVSAVDLSSVSSSGTFKAGVWAALGKFWKDEVTVSWNGRSWNTLKTTIAVWEFPLEPFPCESNIWNK